MNKCQLHLHMCPCVPLISWTLDSALDLCRRGNGLQQSSVVVFRLVFFWLWLGVRHKVHAMMAVMFACVLEVPGCRRFAVQCKIRTLPRFANGFNFDLSLSALLFVPPLPRNHIVFAVCGAGFCEAALDSCMPPVGFSGGFWD